MWVNRNLEKLKRILRDNQGIGLVEAIIAITFALVIIVTLIALTNFNLQNSVNVDIRQEAIREQSKTLERLRVIKDTSPKFEEFITETISKCDEDSTRTCSLDENDNILDNCDTSASGIVTCFKVSTLPASEVPTASSNDAININLVTYFKVRNSQFSSALSTVFTNWRSQ